MSSALSTRNTHAQRDLPAELPADAGRAAKGIAIVLMAQLMLILDVAVMNVALPRIDNELDFGPASLSWVLNAYTLAFGGLLLLGGLAQSPTQLVIARALQGVGAAMAAPSVLALLTTSAPDEAADQQTDGGAR